MYPIYLKDNYETEFEMIYPDDEFPFKCTQMPWNDTDQSYWTEDEPGSDNAICYLHTSFYCEDQDSLNKFYRLFMGSQFNNSDPVRLTVRRLTAVNVVDWCLVLCS
jgi:hypothetical protein